MRLRGRIGTALFLVALLGGILLGATWKVGQSTYTIGDDLTSVGGVRVDTRATLADADGEYTLPQFTATGDMRTKDEDLNATVGGAVLGNGFPLRLTFADPAADTYTAAQAVTTARTRVRAVAGTSGLVVSFDGGTTDHLTVLPNTEIEMGLPIGAGVTIAVKRYTAGTAFTNAIMEVR